MWHEICGLLYKFYIYTRREIKMGFNNIMWTFVKKVKKVYEESFKKVRLEKFLYNMQVENPVKGMVIQAHFVPLPTSTLIVIQIYSVSCCSHEFGEDLRVEWEMSKNVFCIRVSPFRGRERESPKMDQKNKLFSAACLRNPISIQEREHVNFFVCALHPLAKQYKFHHPKINSQSILARSRY